MTEYKNKYICSSVQFSSVTQSSPTLCDTMNRSTGGLPFHHQLPEFTQTHVHRVGDAIQHLILCHPLLLLPSIPPSIKVFSNESTLPMRWPKYWSFSFSISLPNEHPGLISFRLDWLDILAELPYDPAIPLLGIHTKETRIERDVYPNVHRSTVYNSQDMETT